MTEIHPWPTAVAERIAVELAAVADDRLVAVYLHGSAVLGGWMPGRSDVDVLVVAADDIDNQTADAMTHAIVRASRERLPDDCVPRIESSIVTSAAAREPRPPWPFLRHVATDAGSAANVVGPEVVGDRDLLMHYVACRTAGLSVFGPPPQDLIGPIARADILAYHADELNWGLANAPERYAVLNACRALLYLADGAFVSKIAGGEAALQRGIGPPTVITRALAQQSGTQPDQPPATDAIAFVEAATAMLRHGT